MDASRAVLAECGLEGLTVQEVVARARTSVGSFYARFSGKDELLRYLETTARADVEEQWNREFGARLEGASSLAGCVNVLVAALAETYCGQTLRGRAQAALLGVAGELDLHVRDRISRVLLERRSVTQTRSWLSVSDTWPWRAFFVGPTPASMTSAS